MKNQPKPSQIVLMASGAVMLIFSFFNFVEVSAFSSTKGFSAWSGDAFFPLSWWPVLFGVVIAGVVAATTFANVKLPEQVLTLNWKQIYLLLSFAGFIILVSFLLFDFSGLIDRGIGYWFMLLASIGLLAGSVMELLDKSAAGSGPSRQGPATPF